MVREARLVHTDDGLVPETEGWFVVNARDARWWRHENFGSAVTFEGDDLRFPDFGINIQVLLPRQPNCMYHGENAQEDFLVLYGQCLLVVEGEERPLTQWDFVHCPAWTEHVFVGAGDGPCAILMIGARGEKELRYPASELAAKYGASSPEDTPDPSVAYRDWPGEFTPVRAEWPPPAGRS